ncbi:WG repeat-containing protein [Olsenella sp. Marseille-P4559]|uniref:WG repeat-containing protein n=1 Tax=Olsenella sp. Marseille-P4559 TaxID=2364795 RepID=UPI001031BA99|nr:WG repeat-containing protein [Olsenella sp. Marseille-P4559]
MPAQDVDTGLCGYVDEGGSWAIEPSFSYAGPFSGSLAVARPRAEPDGEPDRIVTYVDGTPVPKTEDLPSNRLVYDDKDLDLDYKRTD